MIDFTDLRRIGLNRWTVPILADIAARDGARFAELHIGLGIARESLTRTLAHAIACGWVARHAGNGHPLRPEYVLTEAGAVLAAVCGRMMRVRQRFAIAPEALPRWSVPIVHRLSHDPARFSELRHDLAPVTSRALSINLKQMLQGGLVMRQTDDGFPPSALYGLKPPGRALLAAFDPAPFDADANPL